MALRFIRSVDFPITSRVDVLNRVGADRLAAAVAANHLRPVDQAAIIVDSGTAITVDAVSAQGEFLGGAIAPGWRMSADALHRVADLLPQVQPVEKQPIAIGTNTEAAIRSGLYFGAVGVVRELVQQIQSELATPTTIFVTGGGARMLSDRLENATIYPDLVLSGIVLAEQSLSDS